MNVTPVLPRPEPVAPQTVLDPAYFNDAPAELFDPTCPPYLKGRLNSTLRQVAQLRDGNAILRQVAETVAANFLNLAPPVSQNMITAMTQLAVTGSNAFAAWSANPILLAPLLTQLGMPLSEAVSAAQDIMADFDAARQAVRNPAAGINEDALRAPSLMAHKWIAVSGEDDSPDFPVNVKIAPFPQFHLPLTIAAPLGPVDLSVRYILASDQVQGAPLGEPYIPPGDEVILFIHGEGSRAEEALDFISALFSVAPETGRRFTVVSMDLPGFGYTLRTNGIRGPLAHQDIAPMPAQAGFPGVIDTSSFAGSPIADFIANTIVAFMETLIVPFGNPVTAVIGGSLGGHMALRLAASQKEWVRNVVAWSPASVEEHNLSVAGIISMPQTWLTNPVLAGRATDTPAWPTAEPTSSREGFFNTVWYQDTANVAAQFGALVSLIVSALVALGAIAWYVGPALILAFLALTPVPPQPLMWYRDDWPTGTPLVPLPSGPYPPAFFVGVAKVVAIQEDLLDRLEIYNTNFRQWHWRICEELLGFTFDALAPNIDKPLLLMVGQDDDYPDVHFYSYVQDFAAGLNGPGHALTVIGTGHSIHNERPFFLAREVLKFAPIPAAAVNNSLTEFFAEIIPSIT
jgi:pimeloyl-ACP methyl ester carboxylesterase